MILTTGNSIEGRRIREYKGIVFGEVITGINAFKDMAAAFRNLVGGRSQAYEGEIRQAREEALQEMRERAEALGANAIIGIAMEYETFGADNGMVMVGCNGTAVVLE